jgi:hypothetical protein
MIPNQASDSSRSGFLQPGRSDEFALDSSSWGFEAGSWVPGGLEGQNLEDFIQQFVAGVAGLDGTLTRPRWQPEPPNIPAFGTTWAAVGIMRRRPLGFVGAVLHNPANDGHDLMLRHEQLEVLVTFYGPQCDDYSSNLHDGLMIWQNREVLRLVGMGFVEITESIRVPEYIKNQWVDRVDKTLFINRIIVRRYPVLNLLSAAGAVMTEVGYTSPITVPSTSQITVPSTSEWMSFDIPPGLDAQPLYVPPPP